MKNPTEMNGKVVDFDATVALMDDDLRDSLHSKMVGCQPQDFLEAYAKLHAEQFSEEFVVN